MHAVLLPPSTTCVFVPVSLPLFHSDSDTFQFAWQVMGSFKVVLCISLTAGFVQTAHFHMLLVWFYIFLLHLQHTSQKQDFSNKEEHQYSCRDKL